LRPVKVHLLVELYLFGVVPLNQIYLDNTSMVRVKFVHDYVDVGVRELKSGASRNLGHEEIDYSLTSAEFE